MKMQKLVSFFAFLIPVFGFTQPGNINISNTAFFEGEPYLAVNPVNPQNIVIGWMALDLSTGLRMSIKSKASFDGGATWGNLFIHPHMGSSWYSADVFLQFCSDGTVYLGYIDYHESPDSGGVFLSHSADGGITWSAPVQVFDLLTDDPEKRPVDRPWLAIDHSSTMNGGMFYVTTKPAPWIPPPNHPYLKSSADSGLTWSAWRYVDTTNYLVGNIIQAPMASPTTTADGALCIAYPSFLLSQSLVPKYFLAKSYSRGMSFDYYDLLVNPIPVADTVYKLGYCLAANPSDASQLAFAFPAQPDGDPDIFIASSRDGGITWSTPVRVNDDPVGNGIAQDMVWASYDRDNKLVVTWRDRRYGSGPGYYQPSDIFCAVSFDNGATFQPNVRLSNMTAPFDSVLVLKGNDFLSCESVNDTIYAAWGDVRTGNLNIWFAKTSDSTGLGLPPIRVDGIDAGLISIYPNPSRGTLYIAFHRSVPVHIDLKILDPDLREVMVREISNSGGTTVLDVSGMAPGVYFIVASHSGQYFYTGKIILEK